jgi:hypothetical protein
MYTTDSAFFSWTARRVVLAANHRADTVDGEFDDRRAARYDVTLDITMTVGRNRGRLIAFRDATADVAYVVLILGHTNAARDVPVRIVDEDVLLIEGSRETHLPVILIGVQQTPAGEASLKAFRREVNRQLCVGGPIREVLQLSEAESVDIDWYTEAPAA